MDKRLEDLSDKVRSGEPVDFFEALEVIGYQEHLRAEREAKRGKTLFGRFVNWIKRKTVAAA